MEQHGYKMVAFHLKVMVSDVGSKAEVLSKNIVWSIN